MYDFILHVFIAGILIVIGSSFLGSFILWRGSAYFSDAMSHGTLIGAIIALAFGFDPIIGVFISCGVFSILYFFAQKKSTVIHANSILGVISYTLVAFGLIISGILEIPTFDMDAYLFGDLLAIGESDLIILAIGCAVIIGIFFYILNDFMIITINKDIAIAEGVNINKVELLFSIAIAIIVAISIRTVGAMFISAMLVLLPSTARQVSSSPLGMVGISIGIGVFSVLFGVLLSIKFNIPPGACIVGVASIFFCTIVQLRRFF